MQKEEHKINDRSGRYGTLNPELIKGFQSDIDCAYAAGFFDGEGHINVRINTGSNKKKYKALHVNIGQSTIEVLEWLQHYYGGNIYHYPAGKNKHRKNDFWQWSIVGTRAWKFVQQIKPHLKVKQEQVRNAVIEWETRHDGK